MEIRTLRLKMHSLMFSAKNKNEHGIEGFRIGTLNQLYSILLFTELFCVPDICVLQKKSSEIISESRIHCRDRSCTPFCSNRSLRNKSKYTSSDPVSNFSAWKWCCIDYKYHCTFYHNEQNSEVIL